MVENNTKYKQISKRNINLTILIILSLFLLIFFTFSTHFLSNLLTSMVEYGVYIVPKESNFFDFVVLESNNGSGNWWVYAKDNKNYYYGFAKEADAIENSYGYISILEAESCVGFSPTNFSTWCVVH